MIGKESWCAGCEHIRRISVWLEPVEYVCPAEFDPEDGDCPRHREYRQTREDEKETLDICQPTV